jgi:D-proline reductase (dithiol) PrdB
VSTSKPINYMERTRDYYRAQGFEKDYAWAHHDQSPFVLPSSPLSSARVTIVTTAVTHPEIPKPVRRAQSLHFDTLPDLLDTSEVSWDRKTTHMDDRQSFFPIEVLEILAEKGVIREVAPRYHFVPTQYSHRATVEEDAVNIAAACLEDGVDIALLVPL